MDDIIADNSPPQHQLQDQHKTFQVDDNIDMSQPIATPQILLQDQK